MLANLKRTMPNDQTQSDWWGRFEPANGETIQMTLPNRFADISARWMNLWIG